MGLFFWQRHLFLAGLLALHSFQGPTFIFRTSVSKCKFEILQTQVDFCSYKMYFLLQAKKVDTIYKTQAAKMNSQVMQRSAAWNLSKAICCFRWHSTSSSKNLIDLYFTFAFKVSYTAQKPNWRKHQGEKYKQVWVQVRKKQTLGEQASLKLGTGQGITVAVLWTNLFAICITFSKTYLVSLCHGIK